VSTKSVSLAYKDGGSDKVYHVQIEPKDNGYIVVFQYGRRGSTLNTGAKTANPVPLEQAEKIFDKLVKEKTAKGYSPGEEGTPFAGTDKAGEVSGLVPQLLNSIDQTLAEKLISDNAWIMQEKMDGFHQMARIDGDVTVSNRKGLIVPGSDKIVAALKALIGQPLILDGETIGDVYHAFDILELEGKSLRDAPVIDRYFILNGLLKAAVGSSLRIVRCGISTNDKGKLYEAIKAERGEGVVFKMVTAKYVPGRPASGGNMLKCKFKASATCQVIQQNGNKRSVEIGVVSTPDPTWIISVGNVTIPPNYEVPQAGDLVEVEYLYFFKEGSLFQPVYKGPRPDKSMADLYSTLKFKQGTEEES
jgi:bifunctional non-homologous end joining protein LigD